MFEKFQQYRQALHLPQKNKTSQISQFHFEWVNDLNTLRQVQQFRAEQFSQQFAIRFTQNTDQDMYDFDCEHAVLRDAISGEIVAYTRLKKFNGDELQYSYSAQEFNILPQLQHLKNIVEIGRTCVHQRYRCSRALSLLWMHLLPRILIDLRAKYLIGCVSIHLQDNQARVYHTHQYLQSLAEQQQIDIRSKQAYEPTYPEFSFAQDERIPKLFDLYLRMNAQLSPHAFFDVNFNCLDYFVFLPTAQLKKSTKFKQIQKHR
ncbi:GNAT family N-acetyltransferase [Acinetobacter qingfengensis]|uniref:L-ornithine N(alpha)-acyltransferase n=1 Tax=Acinetobacter qingfengensis TaxID=1262585 RepID=A0A1E7REJ5_9GAMM|nr:GNAT family N-acetyltransferase [Acinetobacter qingfengensis]KAA8731150.1 GNAT family N-acetyltransferase [Acinetobacter qingfengensis]OEY97819.1 GNAT family N-acetyltransferase [Acinetobacter qingfengensis]